MSTTTTADIIRAFDNAQARKADLKARDLRSAHRRQTSAKRVASSVKVAIATVPVGLLVAVVLALV